ALRRVMDAIATVPPALDIIAMRIGAEHYAARLQCRPQFTEHARQCRKRHMKQRSVGKNAIEPFRRQLQCEEILLPDLAATMFPRHRRETRAPLETDGDMAVLPKRLEITAGATAEIEDLPRRRPLDGPKQRRDIRTHVMVASACPEFVGML